MTADAHAPDALGLGGVLRGLLTQPLSALLLAVPVAATLSATRQDPLWVFLASGLAIVPLAGLMGRATENLAVSLGPGVGGLLNATFGNAAELIIALAALRRHRPPDVDMFPLVKASLTGSIIGNTLLVLGLAVLAGGVRYRKQTFNRTAAGMGATLLALATVGLIVPTLYYYVLSASARPDPDQVRRIEYLSDEMAMILAGIHALSLVFTLASHRHLFAGTEDALPTTGPARQPEWGRTASLAILALATAGVAWMSELLVGTVEHAAHELGMTKLFVGVVVVAVIGNAAEHFTAVLVALKDKMDLAFQIAVGSGIQIALFVAPALVFASAAMGQSPPLDLHFTPLETAAVILAVGVLALVSQDGETHWMEGVLLLGVYAILGLAFFHLPEAAH
jgi:Ca2+:H+ antiporter